MWEVGRLHNDVFLDSKKCQKRAARCASANHDLLVEGMRAPEFAKGQQTYRIEWDARDGRNGGAERIVWKTLTEMVIFNNRAGEQDPGAITLVLDLAKAFDRVGFPVVWAWATDLTCPTKI